MDPMYIFFPGDASLVGLVEICVFNAGSEAEQ